MLCFLVISTCIIAQPGNPEFGLRASTYFELDLQSIALLDIEEAGNNANFNLNVNPPTEAGNGFDFGTNPLATNNNLWLNYTCAIPIGISRNIQVSISNGTLPTGFELTLQVGGDAGAGGGNIGSAASGIITLSAAPQNIITNIGGAYTGNGSGSGNQLTYSLNVAGVTNFEDLFQSNSILTILYTIIDD